MESTSRAQARPRPRPRPGSGCGYGCGERVGDQSRLSSGKIVAVLRFPLAGTFHGRVQTFKCLLACLLLPFPPSSPPSPAPPPPACQIYVRFTAVWPSLFFVFCFALRVSLSFGDTMNNTPHTQSQPHPGPALLPAPVESIVAPFIPPNQSSLMPTLTMSMSIASTLCCI